MRVWMLGAAAVALVGCTAGREEERQPLAGAGAAASSHQPMKGTAADNSRCYVCHINYSDEELTVKHARGGIGCATCHGSSDAHCGDENNITPPDILYAKSRIVPACLRCHSGDTLAHADRHCPVFVAGKTEKTCTECHGAHHMSVRTVRWDKETRKLLPKERSVQ